MFEARTFVATSLATLLVAATASAQTPPPPAAVTVTTTTPTEQRVLFKADPVIDGAIVGLGGGWALLSSLIIGTGEIRPQQIDKKFDTDQLLGIDRIAITQHVEKHAGPVSNALLFFAYGFAVLDPVMSGFREKSARSGLVDGLIYAEALAVSAGVTNLSKLAVRRPRPIAYIEFNKHKNDPTYDNQDTDSSLSFVSNHASTTGAVSGVATYLAFARSPHSWRPWVTLVAGAAVTSFVSFERVRAGEHFPTDVIAGALGGYGVGIITAHLHRDDSSQAKPMWIGWQQSPYRDGGALTVNGLF